MDIQNGVALRVFAVEKKHLAEGEVEDPCRAWVHMPVGTKPVGIVKTERGIGVCAILPRVLGSLVAHPVLVLQNDVPVVPLIGRSLGEPMGFLDFGGGVVLTLVPELPWPNPVEQAAGHG